MPSDSNETKVPMPQSIGRSGIWWWWLSAIAIVLDQATKLWVQDAIEYGARIELLPIFNLGHLHNYGAAFSILSEAGGWQRTFLTVLALVISGVLMWWMRQTPKTNLVLGMSYSLILGGAIGNIIDRVAYGYVVDFLHFYYQDWHFPMFNIADSAITLGAMLLIYDAFTSGKDKSN